jgi:hypothetical protein
VKPAKVSRDVEYLNDIFETLKSVPKSRLWIVRDFVGTLAAHAETKKGGARSARGGRKSLLKTSFCGMWKARMDIGSGRTYAKSLRRRLENRGD